MNCLLTLLLFLLCASADANVTNYFSYSTGVDSDNGLTPATAQKLLPWMAGYGGSLAPMPGDVLVQKGGDVWPHTAFPLIVTAGGAPAAPITIITNGSWGTGKPVWDDTNGPLDGGLFDSTGDAFIYIEADNVTISSVIITNLNWGATGEGVYGVNNAESTNAVLTNCDFGGFFTSSATNDALQCVRNRTDTNCQGNKISHCAFCGKPGTGHYGYANYYGQTFEYNTVSFMPNGFVGECDTNQYNVFHDIQSGQPGVHENALEVLGTFSGACFVRGNILTNNQSGTQIDAGPSVNGGNFYVYNNIVGANAETDTAGIIIDPGDRTFVGSKGNFYCWNNILQDGNTSPALAYIRVADRGTCQIASVTAQNNQFISEGSSGVVPDPFVTATITSDHNLTNNNATAVAAGYTTNNVWKPTSGSAPTVGAGTAAPQVVFNTDLLGVLRQFVWDIGAYQWGAQLYQAVLATNGASISVTAVASGAAVSWVAK